MNMGLERASVDGVHGRIISMDLGKFTFSDPIQQKPNVNSSNTDTVSSSSTS